MSVSKWMIVVDDCEVIMCRWLIVKICMLDG